MRISLTDVYMCIYYCLLSTLLCAYLQVYVFIYTVVMPPIGTYLDILLVTDCTTVDVLAVQIQMLYYIHIREGILQIIMS